MRTTIKLTAMTALLLGLGRPAAAQPEELPGEPQDVLPAPAVEVDLDVADVEVVDIEEPAPRVTLERLQARVSPHGYWIHLPGLGQVWKPHPAEVGVDFRPYYTGGRWTLTDAGWSFAAEWPWGEVVFHYGRWLQSEAHGWVWVPGTEWAASWCDWRVTDDYVGWAPLPPAHYSYGGALYARWTFVPTVYLGYPGFHRYRLAPHQVRTVYHRAHRASHRWWRHQPRYRGWAHHPRPRRHVGPQPMPRRHRARAVAPRHRAPAFAPRYHAPRRTMQPRHAPRRAMQPRHAPRRMMQPRHAPRRMMQPRHAPRRAMHQPRHAPRRVMRQPRRPQRRAHQARGRSGRQPRVARRGSRRRGG